MPPEENNFSESSTTCDQIIGLDLSSSSITDIAATIAHVVDDDEKRLDTDADSSSKIREQILDTFPVTEEELDQILIGFEQFEQNKETMTFSSFHTTTTNTNDIFDGDRLKRAEEIFLLESSSTSTSSMLIQAALENVFLIGTGHDDSDQFKFIEAISALLGRRGARSSLQIIYFAAKKASTSSSTSSHVSPEALTGLVYRLIQASSYLQTSQPETMRPAPKAWTMSLQQKVRNQEEGVTLPIWTEWVNAIAPQIYQALTTFVHYALFPPDHPFRPNTQPLQFPKMMNNNNNSKGSALWRYNYQTAPSSLALLSPNFGGDWTNLYSSDEDGFAFSTFQEALLSYTGATVILVQTVAGDSFGFYTNYTWKESRHWYGRGAESFLFALKPTLQFYGIEGDDDKQFNMFLNNPLNPRPGDLTGLAIGGISEKMPRLHINPTFEQCKASSMDGVYTSGPLLADGELFFNIDVIEVWAISNSEDEFTTCLQAGRLQKEFREGIRIKAATVDRKQFLEDFQSGQYANSLYAHREQSRGRHSFCADDDGKGYFIEEKQPSAMK